MGEGTACGACFFNTAVERPRRQTGLPFLPLRATPSSRPAASQPGAAVSPGRGARTAKCPAAPASGPSHEASVTRVQRTGGARLPGPQVESPVGYWDRDRTSQRRRLHRMRRSRRGHRSARPLASLACGARARLRALQCAGMSSYPSSVCRHGAFGPCAAPQRRIVCAGSAVERVKAARLGHDRVQVRLQVRAHVRVRVLVDGE